MAIRPAAEASVERSLRSLVAEQHRFVWRVLRGFGLSAADAEDAAQQVFMILARKLDDIAPGRERAFVYGLALRVANNARRGLRRRREVPSDDQPDAPTVEGASPERQSELLRARQLLADLLQELPEKLRRVLVLAEVEQLEVPEIAALEGIPVGTAASRLRLARQQFRARLEAARERNPFSSES
ncbi:MAG: RNA polymerase sigma factor [Polyangiaceae bacterium]